MPAYDGDIKLSVGLSPADIKKTAGVLQKEIKNILNAGSGNTSVQFKKLQADMAKAVSRADELSKAMDLLSTKKRPTSFYKETQDQLKQEQAQLEVVAKKYNELRSLGFPVNDTSVMNARQQMDELIESTENLKLELRQLEEAGEAFEFAPGDEERYQALANRLNDVNNQLLIYAQRGRAANKENQQNASQTVDRWRQVGEAVGKVGAELAGTAFRTADSVLKRIANSAKSAARNLLSMATSRITGGISKLGSALFRVRTDLDRVNKGFKVGFRTVLKYALGVRSLYFLFRKIRSAIKEGFENLAQWNSGMNPVNASISQMVSSLNYLKNSLATAFAPIANIALPALSRLVDGLAKAISTVGKFIAALTGRSTFIQAKKTQINYAASLNKTAAGANKAAKATNKQADAIEEVQKNLAGFDDIEILQDNSKSDSPADAINDALGGGGGGGGIGDMFEEVPIESAIKKFADKIRDYIKRGDWEGLGKELATQVNKGLKKLYDVFDPKNVRKYVFPWIDAFTKTFNSFVRHLDWDLLGRVVGRGINAVVMSLNRLITGIDWELLGRSFSKGFYGLVDELDFAEIGRLMGNKFMIMWNMLYGFVNDFTHRGGWKRLGEQLANGVNAMWSTIDLSKVATALAGLLNGIFKTLEEFALNTDWGMIAKNITDGINTFIHKFSWKANGQALWNFINSLLNTLLYIVDNTDWAALGEGIANFLQQIDWGKLLYTVAHTIVTVLGGLLEGMMKTPAGRAAVAFFAAFTAYKIMRGDWLPFINNLVKAFTGKGATTLLASGVKAMMGNAFSALGKGASAAGAAVSKGLSGAGKAVSTFASTTAGSVTMTAGFFGALIVGAEQASKGIEKLKGGNGILTDVGKTMHAFADELSQVNVISGQQADEIYKLIEAQEHENMTQEEVNRLTSDIVKKLGEYGVSADTARGFVERLNNTNKLGKDGVEQLTAAIDANAKSMEGRNTLFDLTARGTKTTEESFKALRDAVIDASMADSDLSAQQEYLLQLLESTRDKGGTANDAYNAIKTAIEDAGGSMSAVNTILSEEFPTAQKVAMESAQQTGEGVKTAYSDMEASTTADQEKMIAEIKRVQEEQRQSHIDYLTDMRDTVTSNADELERWQNDVNTFKDTVKNHLSNVSESWGQLGSDQAQSLESLNTNLEDSITRQDNALKNMEALNRKNLDNATVQAILSQVDPSSEAMNDLVRHMEADDATWQEFKSNLDRNLEVKENVDKSVNDMVNQYAIKTKPAFVEIGANFEAGGQEIGGFIVKGMAGGVYASISDATNALRKVGEDAENALKKQLGISSPSKVMEGHGKNIDAGLANGMRQQVQLVRAAMQFIASQAEKSYNDNINKWTTVGRNTIQKLADGIRQSPTLVTQAFGPVNKAFETEKIAIQNYGTNSGKKFSEGLTNVLSRLGNAVTDALDGVFDALDKFENSMYKAGKQLMKALRNGMQSINIPTPHLYIKDWDWQDFGDGEGTYTPSFGIDWYRAGAFIKGGRGKIVGVGEDNRDEAILPLEDERAMSRIGGAIASASTDVIANAVVDGYQTMFPKIASMMNDYNTAQLPGIVIGSVAPVVAQLENKQAANLKELIDSVKLSLGAQITKEQLQDVIGDAVRQYMNIQFYIGDEQIARHNASGAAKIERRLNPVGAY